MRYPEKRASAGRSAGSNHDKWAVWLGNHAPFLLVLLAFLLIFAAVAYFVLNASTPDDLSKIVDVVLKLGAIALVGLLLPRLAQFEFSGVKFSLQATGDSLSQELNKFEARLRTLEAQAASVPPGPKGAPGEAGPAPEIPRPKLTEPTVANDPQKGRFGGSPERDGYRLSVKFSDVKEHSAVVRIVLKVKKTDGLPFTEPVRFYLHNSFNPREYTIDPTEGQARLPLLVWGGFTAGAWVMNDRATLLELDISKEPNAPYIVREF